MGFEGYLGFGVEELWVIGVFRIIIRVEGDWGLRVIGL